jgi:hypothetical protein
MKHGNRAQGIAASGQTCPADAHAAVLALAPGPWPLGVVARDLFFARPAPRLAALPAACGKLGATPACAAATAQVFGLMALLRCQHRAACARSTPLTRAALRHARTAAWARGQTRHPRRRTATAACRVPRQARGGALAWRPASHRRASTLPPPRRSPLGRPLGPTGEVTPAAAGHQDVEHRMHHLTTGGLGQTSTPLRRRRRKHLGQELPRQVGSPREGSSPGALLKKWRVLSHGTHFSGICS